MKVLLAVLLLAAPLAAEEPPDPGLHPSRATNVAFRKFRLASMYSGFVRETVHPRAAEAEPRLLNYLADSAPVLKNLKILANFLDAGYGEKPEVTQGLREWDDGLAAWKEELAWLKPLAAEGEALAKLDPLPPQSVFSPAAAKERAFPPLREDNPAFSADLRLVEAAYDQREALVRRSRAAAQIAAHGGAKERAENESVKSLP